MNTVQKGVLALGGMLVLVALAAGNCGPDADQLDDRPTITESSEAVGDSRASAPPNATGNAGPRQDARGSDHTLKVRVMNEAGTPLTGARVALIAVAAPAVGPVSVGSSATSGRVTLEGIPAGDFLMTVTAAGYLSLDPVQIRMPSEDGNEVIAQLRTAGRIDGAIYSIDAQPHVGGVVRLSSAGAGGERSFHVRPDERGSFVSGPLESGVWEIAWLPEEGQPPDPRLVMVRAVAAGERVVVEVTVPQDGVAGTPGRRVGIVELSR